MCSYVPYVVLKNLCDLFYVLYAFVVHKKAYVISLCPLCLCGS